MEGQDAQMPMHPVPLTEVSIPAYKSSVTRGQNERNSSVIPVHDRPRPSLRGDSNKFSSLGLLQPSKASGSESEEIIIARKPTWPIKSTEPKKSRSRFLPGFMQGGKNEKDRDEKTRRKELGSNTSKTYDPNGPNAEN
jgi:hypothetical protein